MQSEPEEMPPEAKMRMKNIGRYSHKDTNDINRCPLNLIFYQINVFKIHCWISVESIDLYRLYAFILKPSCAVMSSFPPKCSNSKVNSASS